MPPCAFTLKNNRDPVQTGDQFTITMDPPLKFGCKLSIDIDGVQVWPNPPATTDTAGDFKFNRTGATGNASFEALKNNPNGKISFTLECENPKCDAHTETITIEHKRPDSFKKYVIILLAMLGALTGAVIGIPLGPVGIGGGAAIGAGVGGLIGGFIVK